MFGQNFFPTPLEVIEQMLDGYPLYEKTVFEPSAGRGDIVSYCKRQGANVIACELNDDLRKIVATKCQVIGEDCMKITAEQISHVDYIVMNPPFSHDEQHVLHMWNIAPAGCKIIALINWNTYERAYYRTRQELRELINVYGQCRNLGDVFTMADRKTGVIVGLVNLVKPGQSNTEFDGFFMEEDVEAQANGIMPYDFIRDIVNRYVGAVKIFDEQLEAAEKMNTLTDQFFSSKLAVSVTNGEKPVKRNEFKKDLQKEAWQFIFRKLDMEKYNTRSLKSDLNAFVEKQTEVPFTMRNIYKMLEIIVGTHQSRMDKAMLDAFDGITKHYDENRWNVEGWKTNDCYLVNKRFIIPWMTRISYTGYMELNYSNNAEIIDDLTKALCWLMGYKYEDFGNFQSFFWRMNNLNFGEWYYTGFFKFRGYKKGSMHFEFQNEEVWERFNRKVAELKGYPLPEKIKTKTRKAA